MNEINVYYKGMSAIVNSEYYGYSAKAGGKTFRLRHDGSVIGYKPKDLHDLKPQKS